MMITKTMTMIKMTVMLLIHLAQKIEALKRLSNPAISLSLLGWLLRKVLSFLWQALSLLR